MQSIYARARIIQFTKVFVRDSGTCPKTALIETGFLSTFYTTRALVANETIQQIGHSDALSELSQIRQVGLIAK